MTKIGRVTTYDTASPPCKAPRGMRWVSDGCRRVDDEHGYYHFYHRLERKPPSAIMSTIEDAFSKVGLGA